MTIFTWDPNLHPRDILGRFRKTGGITPQAKRFQRFANRSQIAVRVGNRELAGILKEGRFKTGHEKGVYGKGFPASTRESLERELFYGSKPIYGYLADRYEDFDELDDAIGPYGSIKVVFKEPVRERATVTLDDSMVSVDPKPALVTQITDEAAEGFDHKQAVNFPGYTELQIHGGAKAQEIKEVVFGHGPPDSDLEDLLNKWHIPWRVDPNWKRNKENAMYDEDGNMI